MNTSTKNILKTVSALLITLIIGAMIGGALVGRIAKNRFQLFQDFTNQQGFVEQAIKITKPNDKQLENIRPILEDAGHKVENTVQHTRAEIFIIMEKLEKELSKNLSKEQLKNFNDKRERTRNRYLGKQN